MIGERVRLAREACGLTQDELADRAGVSQGLISHIEAGRVYEPSMDTIAALADGTGFPLSFFERGPLPDIQEGNFRKFARGTSKTAKQIRALARQMVEVVQRYEDSGGKLPPLAINPITHLGNMEEIEYHIQDVRHWLRVGEQDAIGNVMRAVECAGVVVLRLPIEMEDHDGFSVWPYFGVGDARPVIIVTGEHTGDRDRFTVAHELGHLVLHSARRGVNPGRAEDEANRFAGALLLPENTANTSLASPLLLDDLKGVKRNFGISMAAAAMRAFDLGLISPLERTAIFKQLSLYGWRTKEPVRVDPEQPALIQRIIGPGTVKERSDRTGLSPFLYRDLLGAAEKKDASKLTDQNA